MTRISRHDVGVLLLTGLVGLVGAILVGVGEFTLQFSPLGGYENEGYAYFANVSRERLTMGHFISVLAAPMYIVGYWHLGQMLVRGGSRWAGWVVTLLGGYAFMVGNAWLGGRIYLALTAHAIADPANAAFAEPLRVLLAEFSAHNEPLVNVLRLAIVVISVLWIWRISIGQTLYPRWMAIFSPAVLLGLIFSLYFLSPSIGVWLLPAAMNVVHVVLFALSLWAALRLARRA